MATMVTEATRTHGICLSPPAAANAGHVHFGLALWPYDLLLRFGYDLFENDHIWDGEWFDDFFEEAALDIRATTYKLLNALRHMDKALASLDEWVKSDGRVSIPALRQEAENSPLAVDLVATYMRRILDAVGAIIPNCYGRDGRVLIGDRASLRRLARSTALPDLDPQLAGILLREGDLPPEILAVFEERGQRVLWPHSPDLHVVSAAIGDSPALPKAALHALQRSAAVTLETAAVLDRTLRFMSAWFDRLVEHLQGVVAARSEPGAELLDRWADTNWSVLCRLRSRDRSLEAHLPTW